MRTRTYTPKRTFACAYPRYGDTHSFVTASQPDFMRKTPNFISNFDLTVFFRNIQPCQNIEICEWETAPAATQTYETISKYTYKQMRTCSPNPPTRCQTCAPPHFFDATVSQLCYVHLHNRMLKLDDWTKHLAIEIKRSQTSKKTQGMTKPKTRAIAGPC